MNNQSKKKLCWNCEGRVGVQEEHCKFCGVYLSPLNPDDDEDDKKSSLFAPPYRVDDSKEEQIPSSPFSTQKSSIEPEKIKVFDGLSAEAIGDNQNSMSPSILSLVLLSIGTVLFLFGMALVIFSTNGVLSLQWNSEYWFVYFLIAVPALLLGWKNLQQEVY